MSIPSILIVDDSEADRYLLRRVLRRARVDAHLFEARDGAEALAFFAQHTHQQAPGRFPPTLVLLDINMPRVDGFAFLEAFAPIRAQHGYETVVFVMFSSSSRPEDRSRALAYSYVKGYITKMSSSNAELLQVVTSALAG